MTKNDIDHLIFFHNHLAQLYDDKLYEAVHMGGWHGGRFEVKHMETMENRQLYRDLLTIELGTVRALKELKERKH